MQRENKWQDRFDERFNITKYYEGTMKIAHHNMLLGKIKSFIQSEIDTARAERDNEIIEKINKRMYMDDTVFEIINLITKQ